VRGRLLAVSAVALAGVGGAAPLAAAPAPQTLCTLPAGASRLPAATLRGLIGHLEQYPDLSLATPAERRAAQRLLDTLRSQVGRWTTLRTARGAGFQTPPARRTAGDRKPHYLHAERLRERRDDRVFDARRPKALIFAREPGRPAVLVGAMYSVQRGERGVRLVGIHVADTRQVDVAVADRLGDFANCLDLGRGQAEPLEPVAARAPDGVVMERLEGGKQPRADRGRAGGRQLLAADDGAQAGKTGLPAAQGEDAGFFCHRLQPRIGEDELRQGGVQVRIGVEEIGHSRLVTPRDGGASSIL